MLENVDKIPILLAEYNNLRDEIRTFLRLFTPLFTIFSAIVLGSIFFAFTKIDTALFNPKLVFPVIPIFIFLIGYYAISLGYLISALAGRIREIENELAGMNDGVSVMKWESHYTPKFVFKIAKMESIGKIRLPFLNPILFTIFFIALTAAILVVYSCIETYKIMDFYLFVGYIIFIALCFVMALYQTSSFYIFGKIMDVLLKKNVSV